MKMLIAVVMAILLLVLLLIPQLKKYKGIILAAYGFAFMLLVALQMFRTVGLMLPFYQPKDQMFYQKEFAEEGLYPDALIQLLVKNKTVYVKDDRDEYMEENCHSENGLKDGKYWLYPFYHQINMTNFLNAAGAKVVADDSYNNSFISEENQNDFDFAGYGNDMFRFMFLLSNDTGEWSNYFYHYWYYCDHLDVMNVYINPEGVNEAEEIVVLWDDKENETIYIMTKDYYDMEVAVND